MGCSRMLVLVLILLLCIRTDGSGILGRAHRNLEEIKQTSPSPSPGPSVNLDSEKEQIQANGTKEGNCDNVFTKCVIKDFGITACVPHVWNVSEALHLLVLNNDSSVHDISIFVLPTDVTPNNITVAGHDVQKVNLPFNKEGKTSSIMLKIENKSCIIQIRASIQSRFYPDHVTPIHGVYLFVVASVFIGGGWACCKLVKRKQRNLNGVPYQELEMGQHESEPSSFVIESQEGWDENWDDDWDEEKAVRSPGVREVLQNGNGGSLKYVDTSQWGNDWDN